MAGASVFVRRREDTRQSEEGGRKRRSEGAGVQSCGGGMLHMEGEGVREREEGNVQYRTPHVRGGAPCSRGYFFLVFSLFLSRFSNARSLPRQKMERRRRRGGQRALVGRRATGAVPADQPDNSSPLTRRARRERGAACWPGRFARVPPSTPPRHGAARTPPRAPGPGRTARCGFSPCSPP